MITPGVSKHLLLDFVQSLGSKDCHMALLSDKASLDCNTAVFDGTGEIRAQGYAAGGKRLLGFSSGMENGIAWAAWNNVDWQNATIKATGAVIYSKADANRVITVISFGEEKSSSQGLFRVRMPAPGSTDAVFWLA